MSNLESIHSISREWIYLARNQLGRHEGQLQHGQSMWSCRELCFWKSRTNPQASGCMVISQSRHLVRGVVEVCKIRSFKRNLVVVSKLIKIGAELLFLTKTRNEGGELLQVKLAPKTFQKSRSQLSLSRSSLFSPSMSSSSCLALSESLDDCSA
jgi:hypothetical protein